MRRMVTGLLLAAGVASLVVPPMVSPAASPQVLAAPAAQPHRDDGNPLSALLGWLGQGRHAYPVNTTGLADRVAETGRLEVELGPSLRVVLRLREHSAFLPGENRVDLYDENGTFVRSEPITDRQFRGQVADTGEPAGLLVSDTGLYGGVTYQGRTYSFQPSTTGGFGGPQQIARLATGEVLQSVTWRR